MEYPTLLELKTRVLQRLDMEDEEFVVDSELTRYFQEAVDYIESECHKLNIEDQYFSTVAPLTMVSGRADYQLPTNIYANKIQRIIMNRESDIYEVTRLKGINRFTDAAAIDRYGAGTDIYQYQIFHNSALVKPVIRFTPRPQINTTVVTPTIDTTSGSNVVTVSSATGIVAGQFVSSTNIPTGTLVEIVNGTSITLSANASATATATASSFISPDVLIYYIRNANKPSSDTDVIDIPEFSSFIVQYVVVECLKKEIGNPRLQVELAKFDDFKTQMLSTLSNMVPDQRDQVEMDTSFYGDHT